MKTVIDGQAGVCGGVSRALRFAEEALKKGKRLVSIGPLIHNQVEIDRLAELGLVTVPQEVFEESDDWQTKYRGSTLLIRAHGISPVLFEKLENAGFEIIDGTCPKVKRSLVLIEQYSGKGCQIIIVGKAGHPEVKAMVGAAKNGAEVILKKEAAQKINIQKDALIIAQTTTNQQNYLELIEYFREQNPNIIVKNTICNAVSKRHANLKKFVKEHDVVIFVGGKNSSNTKELFGICRNENPNCYLVERFSEIEFQWLRGARSIGLSGSASTPGWQLERIRSQMLSTTQDCTTQINIKEVHLNG